MRLALVTALLVGHCRAGAGFSPCPPPPRAAAGAPARRGAEWSRLAVADGVAPILLVGAAVVVVAGGQALINDALEGEQGLRAFLSDGKRTDGFGSSAYRTRTGDEPKPSGGVLRRLRLPKLDFVEVSERGAVGAASERESRSPPRVEGRQVLSPSQCTSQVVSRERARAPLSVRRCCANAERLRVHVSTLPSTTAPPPLADPSDSHPPRIPFFCPHQRCTATTAAARVGSQATAMPK